MYVLGSIADDGFLKLFLTKSKKKKKKSDVLSGCRNRKIFVFFQFVMSQM